MSGRKQQEKELTAKQMSHEIQQLMKALQPDDFQRVFEKSLLGWIKAIPQEKRKLKFLEDLYPAMPPGIQDVLTRETGFQK